LLPPHRFDKSHVTRNDRYQQRSFAATTPRRPGMLISMIIAIVLAIIIAAILWNRGKPPVP
jgi:hypothetical protein